MSLRGPSSEASSIRSISPGPHPGLRGTRSFTRLESTDVNSDPLTSSLARLRTESVAEESALDGSHEDSDDDGASPLDDGLIPEDFDKLPMELISLADRFISSLTKPIFPAPLSITELSDHFQQFYGTAAQAINTYVARSYTSLASKKGAKKITTQMLSKNEISQKKRDRKLLEAKKIVLQEAVEKRVTEGVYEKLWRHKSTDDEARDDSLHSKIAALKVVGVKLGHLGVELDAPEKQDTMDQDLKEASKSLADMNDKKFPLGKLTLLKQAHKTIVDCLTKQLDTTSADSLLPALIYTLIISPPSPSLNAISNLVFTQRFRASHFIDGEAAYCLTNFEAAISFLETVDLATLGVSGPDNIVTPLPTPKSPETPWAPADNPLSNLSDKLSEARIAAAVTDTTEVEKMHSSSASAISVTDSTKDRKINIFNAPIDLATAAVGTADQGIRGIGTALEGSYRFLFDRRGDNVPKTLEDVRQIVEAPNPAEGALQRGDSSDSTSQLSLHPEPKVEPPARAPSPAPPPKPSTPTPLDPLKTLGTSIGRFANIGMRGFSRSAASPAASSPINASSAAPSQPSTSATASEKDGSHKTHKRGDSGAGVKDLIATFPELAQSLPPPPQPQPVRKFGVDERFMNIKDADELRIAEVPELLVEYQRLVGELRKAGLV
ncbi:hypothetical protein EDC01DRAFT_222341 [Geopyxis carbonaria]|nr:hypothetical protein EDC01DRAFT_222341 [Geopyxis carbonaria]